MRSHSIQEESQYKAGSQISNGHVGSIANSVTCISTTDASVLAKSLSNWQQDYLQISPGQFSGSVKEVSIGSIQIFREVINQSVDQHGQPLPGRFTVGIPVKMQGKAYWCGSEYSSADSVLFLRPDYELKFKTATYSDVYGASVDTDAFIKYYADEEQCDHNTIKNLKELNFFNSERCMMFRQAFDNFFLAIETSPTLLESEPARKQLEFDVISMVFLMTSAIPVSKRPYSNQFVHRYIVDKARQYIVSRKSESLTVTDLCEGLRTTHRSLHYAFKKVLGISPVTYLRYVRLNGVRTELISGVEPMLISEIAAKWGFWHMGMFSTYYRILFGEQPSETRKANRALTIN